ncbi:hypothetical protein LYNGBM3L_01910 [Moorena producens 3L]|uniref:Uncharacterized protein n=1 Tax=Moorena producens 3L TaxID=489825 RepID=F4XIF9_9CYAN|nr:hypothetical protein LYNGBM3L_01910 [Moorena producens 3L]
MPKIIKQAEMLTLDDRDDLVTAGTA